MIATERISDPNHITTGASSAADTAAMIVDALLSRDAQPPNEVKTGATENAWSVSLVLHSAIVLESWLHRLRYFEYRDGDRPRRRLKPIPWLEGKVSEDLRLDLEEVFSLRDVIAHGHLWEAKTANDQYGLRFTEPPFLDRKWFGDDRFWDTVMNADTRQSRRLGLNLYPLRVWRRDAFLSFKRVVEALVALEGEDPTGFRIGSNWGTVSLGDESVTLVELAERLPVPENV